YLFRPLVHVRQPVVTLARERLGIGGQGEAPSPVLDAQHGPLRLECQRHFPHGPLRAVLGDVRDRLLEHARKGEGALWTDGALWVSAEESAAPSPSWISRASRFRSSTMAMSRGAEESFCRSRCFRRSRSFR